MDEKQAREFGRYLQQHREAAGLSIRSVAKQAGVDPTRLLRIESGDVKFPKADLLTKVAAILKIPAADLMTMADYPRVRALPTLMPYLRTKYSNLSPEALAEIEAIVAREHPERIGPADGEDER